jgi:glycosyltransferase involved in cell wall biosynthesis
LFRHVCDLATAQQSAGHEVAVVCASGGDALTEAHLAALSERISLGVHRMSSARSLGLADVFATRRILKLSQDLNVDMLHGHGAKGGAYARLAAQSQPNVRAVYTPHGGSLHYAPTSLKGQVFMGLERRLERMTDGLIFESAYSFEKYTSQVGTPRVPTRVIPNGVQPDEFAPIAFNDDATDLLFVGELRHLKGVDVLLDALALINASRVATATIVGAGPDADVFKAQCARLGLNERVRFPGAKPARDAFKMGRTLVMPSRAESFPYIVLEAGAAALPLIATRVGGIPEIIGDTGSPMLPPGDANGLATFLIETLADPAALQQHTKALQDRIKARFTVAAMTESVLGFYTDINVLAGADTRFGRLALAAE